MNDLRKEKKRQQRDRQVVDGALLFILVTALALCGRALWLIWAK